MTQQNLFNSQYSDKPTKTFNRTSPETVGDRLRKIREERRLDIFTVSQDLTMPIEVIERIEKGEIENFYKEIFALMCRYSISTHEIFKGFFVYTEEEKRFLYGEYGG